MRLKQKIYLYLLLSFSTVISQDMPEIDWKEIETDHYRIIFSTELILEANRVANILENIYKYNSIKLGGSHRKIPIVLRNRSAIPNAFVSLGPWFSEWNHIPLPLKEIGSTEWYKLLSIHEGRHMFQFSYLNRGINKLFWFIGGENMQAIVSGTMIPNWIWEGDAVLMETILSRGGRGRQPFFNREIRALLSKNKETDYRSALYGSFINEYPNYYNYGYLINAHIRRKYGKEAISHILDYAMHWPIIRNPIMPLNSSLVKITGRNASLIFSDAMEEIANDWESQLKGENYTKFSLISPSVLKGRIDYIFPGFDSKNRIYAIKRGLSEKTSLVRIKHDGSIENLVQLPEIVENFGIHISGNLAVWNEIHPDRRWSKQSWSNIIIFNIEDESRQQITRNKRYYYPSISPKGNTIVTVEFNEKRDCFLVIIDARNGNVINRISSESIIMHPRWSPNGKQIVFISQSYDGRSIKVLNISDGNIKVVKPESNEEIFRPIFYENFVIYESPISGIDNLYAIDQSSREIFRIVSSKISATNALIGDNGKKLIYNDYDLHGDKIVSATLDSTLWEPIKRVKIRPDPLLSSFEQINNPMDDLSNYINYEAIDYNHLQDLLKIHSWLIIPNNNQPSIMFHSNNILGTLELFATTTYNQNEKFFFHEISGSYKRYYPILIGSLGWGGRSLPDTLNVSLGKGEKAKSYILSTWGERNFSGKIILPIINRRIGPMLDAMNFSISLQKTLIFGNKIRFKWDNRDDLRDTTLTNKSADGAIFPLSVGVKYESKTEGAPRDVMNGKGRHLDFSYTSTPFKSNFKGRRVHFSGGILSKGIFNHDSFKLVAAVENKKNEGYPFMSKLNMPLGHKYFFQEKIVSIKGSYRVPIFYPESGFDMVPMLKKIQLGYVKRISFDLFFHWLRGKNEEVRTDFITVGFGSTFEVAGFGFPIVLPVTLFYAYRPLKNSGSLELTVDF
ncbi:MAG: hypothetical protein CMG75_00405 [Candidatus Marinimicrobia bacterium]|nr:hypothetical protein [Candidatus Neomarinimicrobiota bacterium]|tara:strand:+ start:4798 stop:7680 length:2883 start_codon:yes stop_codon:yes gene_type:complete